MTARAESERDALSLIIDDHLRAIEIMRGLSEASEAAHMPKMARIVDHLSVKLVHALIRGGPLGPLSSAPAPSTSELSNALHNAGKELLAAADAMKRLGAIAIHVNRARRAGLWALAYAGASRDQ